MPLIFYAQLFGLSPLERSKLERLMEDNEARAVFLEELTEVWKTLRSVTSSDEQCRQMFTLQTMNLALKKGMGCKQCPRLPSAFALCLTDEIQSRVQKMEGEKLRARWN